MSAQPQSLDEVRPPLAERRVVKRRYHGIDVEDAYGWLRADNWQEVMRDPTVLDTQIRAHLLAENADTERELGGTRELQGTLFAEMKARLKQDDSTVPASDGHYEYYSSFVKGGQYPRLCRRAKATSTGEAGGDVVLLDGNAEAKGKPYWHLGSSAHSPDHTLLAYATDDKGSELYTIRVRDLASGVDLADTIPDTRGEVVWASDNRTLFYVRLDENHRPSAVYRHTLGAPASDDYLVYEEPDKGFFVSVSKTQSSRFILIDAHDHQTSEIRIIDAEAPQAPLRLVSPRDAGHEYQVEHEGDRLVVLTNSGGAEDFRICSVPVSSVPSRPDEWSEIVAHKPGRLIIEAVAYKGHMVRLEREESLPRLVIRRLADGAEHAISFPEEAYGLGLFAGYEFDTTSLRFTYSSMTTPAETYDYDMDSRARVLRKRQEVPSGHNPADYITRRLFAPAADGETVPVTLLHRKDTPIDGSAPVLLYGYGAYGISIPASFATARLSLVDRGFIYAIAHIRGGKDKGYRWYTSGKHTAKRNTFTDFIAAAEHLIEKGYTRPGRIVAHGGSAGGMLMGAVANMAPELFLGIIADVPFVDVLNTMLDKDLPLTPPEWPEWGNPLESRSDFDLIGSYSPYDNVGAQQYPHILALAGLTDPRVTYWEPAKWVAKLREKSTGRNLLLLRTNMDAGHGGASGRYEALKETALEYAFALLISGRAGADVGMKG